MLTGLEPLLLPPAIKAGQALIGPTWQAAKTLANATQEHEEFKSELEKVDLFVKSLPLSFSDEQAPKSQKRSVRDIRDNVQEGRNLLAYELEKIEAEEVKRRKWLLKRDDVRKLREKIRLNLGELSIPLTTATLVKLERILEHNDRQDATMLRLSQASAIWPSAMNTIQRLPDEMTQRLDQAIRQHLELLPKIHSQLAALAQSEIGANMPDRLILHSSPSSAPGENQKRVEAVVRLKFQSPSATSRVEEVEADDARTLTPVCPVTINHFKLESGDGVLEALVTFGQSSGAWQRVSVTGNMAVLRKALRNDGLDEHPRLTYDDIEDYIGTFTEAIRRETGIQIQYPMTNLEFDADNDSLAVRVNHGLENDLELIPSSDYRIQHYKRHYRVPIVPERELRYHEHIAGWVYRVRWGSQILVRKDIVSKKQLGSFKSELDALLHLNDPAYGTSVAVVKVHGLVTDNTGGFIVGILVDNTIPFGRVLRDDLTWTEKWRCASQIMNIVAAVHARDLCIGELNYAQFGLVEDEHGGIIKLLGLKRRGCPVGWETPDILADAGGVRGDGIFGDAPLSWGQGREMYQLGLLLRAIALGSRPEDGPRAWNVEVSGQHAPLWYREMVAGCMSKEMQDRKNVAHWLTQVPKNPTRLERVLVRRPF
jgi:hypothetical protein